MPRHRVDQTVRAHGGAFVNADIHGQQAIGFAHHNGPRVKIAVRQNAQVEHHPRHGRADDDIGDICLDALKLHQGAEPDVILVRGTLPFGRGPPRPEEPRPVPDRKDCIGVSAVNRQQHGTSLRSRLEKYIRRSDGHTAFRGAQDQVALRVHVFEHTTGFVLHGAGDDLFAQRPRAGRPCRSLPRRKRGVGPLPRPDRHRAHGQGSPRSRWPENHRCFPAGCPRPYRHSAARRWATSG